MRYYVERGEIRRFVIKCRVANQNSNNVARRNGFTEGCLREAEYLNGRYDDVNLYGRVFPYSAPSRGVRVIRLAINHFFAAQMNAVAVESLNDGIVGDFNVVLNQYVAADPRPP